MYAGSSLDQHDQRFPLFDLGLLGLHAFTDAAEGGALDAEAGGKAKLTVG
ncbi:MAG: hypothetical protein ABUL46_02660 [Chitinophaga rupis]